MTAADKKQYLLRFHRFQKSREQYFSPQIFKAIREQYSTVLNHIHAGYTEHEAISKITAAPITAVLKQLYIDAGTIYGAKIRADLKRQKHRLAMGFSEMMHQLITEYFRTDILNQSEGITATTKDLIRQVFTEAYSKGEGIEDIVKKLENTELSRMRSRLIARTETVTSANAGALMVAKSTGLTLNKQWLSANDSRVRLHHKAENGKVVGIDELFQVGPDKMSYPGDHGGRNGQLPVSVGNIVNCRCTTLYLVQD